MFAAFVLLPTRFWPRTDRELPFLAIALFFWGGGATQHRCLIPTDIVVELYPGKETSRKFVIRSSTPVCVAMPTIFFCKQSDRQLEPPLPLNFSCRIFRISALAPNFPLLHYLARQDMGSLVHTRECGKATAVSVTSFHPNLVAEN